MSEMQIETEELRDGARRFLEKAVDRRAPYADEPTDQSATLRATMAELGWMLLTVPEADEGLGQPFTALVPIYQELGRALAPVPFAGSMAAIDALATAQSEEAKALLAGIGSGEAVVVVADGSSTTVADGKVSGQVVDVVDAGKATHLLLVPETGDGSVCIVDLSDAAVSLTEASMWDRTRSIANIALNGAAAGLLISGNAAREAAQVARAHLDLANACDSIGGGERALEEAIAYMGTRQQFNRPIGSFQALKHRSADLKVGLEIARAMINDACAAYVERREGWQAAATQAKLLATDSYRAIAEESVQFHGGIGFTWEYDCHLFLKRAFLNEQIGGTPEQNKDRIAPYLLGRSLAGRSRKAA